ncbi:MAG TPA: 2-dehydropantoate 2-reductase [Roseiflexaceae bacterium]|nr:2-dehydropantoate 2-reductase [Roseiflexaceae bacterium]
MKLTIIGAGAMGSLLAFYLSARAEVWLLDSWQTQVDAINARGITCERDGHAETRPARATADPAAIGGCDAALVLVKAHQTPWAADMIRRSAAAATPGPHEYTGAAAPPLHFVVTLQNGLGNREVLAAALGEGRVGQGVTALGATLLGPGRVRHAGQGLTVFGAHPNRAAAEALATLFAACGLPSEVGDNLEALVWGKLVVNAGINALTALLRVPNGALAEVPQARALLEAAVREAAGVAAARGVRLPYDDPLAHTLAVVRATAANRSSMLQDVLRGSPTEVETINGAVAREGERLGVPTPVNRTLAELVRALEACASLEPWHSEA